ncbi:urease accessory protein UreD [Streptomyces lycii]|uniref:Urease accessory protein UreD n=1 Tax=Streptomyces lycii TaxID=2654337 RepID=A0ABQ7FS91_9ACTN|nr:urease accessory protein UreD [Streptomyces lycii]KAF4410483.1 urease accessory protein UreD [Streptomyces lycii]
MSAPPVPGTKSTADRTGGPSSVRATARIRAAADGRGGTALPVLEGDGPLAPRRVRGGPRTARVCLVGAMSVPLNGDRLRLDAEAGDGAALEVRSAAATVALPGRYDAPAAYDVHLTAGRGAGLRWLPEPVISVAGSVLRLTTRVDADPSARVVLREEQVLGRAGEGPGRLTARLTVRVGGRPLLDQETDYGPGASPGWDGPAVLGGHRAAGQLLLLGPERAGRPGTVLLFGSDDPGEGQAVLTPLAGSGALVTAVAPDALRLRRLLDAAAEAAGPPAAG